MRLLRKTLASIYSNTMTRLLEVIVVDDASTDGSIEMVSKYFPKVILVRNKKNIGYSKSYNKGTHLAKGRYILHLNSDITLKSKNSLDIILQYMETHKRVGIVGCRLFKNNGTLDLPCKRSFPTLKNILFQSVGLSRIFPKNRTFGEYYLTYLDENEVNEVDCLMGAFMFIRKKVFDEIGYLDERFFIYGEDIDFCYRTKKAGWKIVYYPLIAVQHRHGGTTRQFKLKHIWRFHYAMIQYYRKHTHNPPAVQKIVEIGILLRFMGTLIIECLYVANSKFKAYTQINKRNSL